jgi:two-component system, response regulator YesN
MEIYRKENGKRVIDLLPSQDVGFNIRYAASKVLQYSRAVDAYCTIIDSEGGALFNTEGTRSPCSFCKKIQELFGNRINCTHAHLYGGYQAERHKGRYTFYCPVGLVHWASPIIINDMLCGTVIGGPVLMEDVDDFIADLLQKNESLKPYIHELREQLKSIKRIDQDKLDSYADLLELVTAAVSRQDSPYFEERPAEEASASPRVSDYIYYLKTMGGEEVEKSGPYPLDKERELLSYIANGDKKAARKTLNEILGFVFFSSGNNFDIVKARILELIVLLSRAAMEGGADVEEIFGMNYHYINQIHNFTTIEQLTAWVARIMNRFSDLVFNLADVKHVDVIFKALDYIKKNYMNKISLQDVAEAASISPSYFSKVFKDEMHCNFNIYLNHFRVEVAKKLLLDINIPLVNVAFMTGFEDQSYFTKVFKKITKMSPGKYRESLGRIKDAKTG